MARFRLLRGIHNEGGKTYKPGDVFDSASDLGRHNRGGGIRFEKLTEAVPISETPTNDDLSRMTVPSLRELAEREEIDLGQAVLKDDILETIREELALRTKA